MLEQYVNNFLKDKYSGRGKVAASLIVADSWHKKSDGATLARKIRGLYNHYRVYNSLPLETRGGKRSGDSLLNDEKTFATLRDYLLEQPVGTVSIRFFHHALHKELFPRLCIMMVKPLQMRTAQRWLIRLGFSQRKEKKGVYIDGHERPDVIEYRDKVFLPAMAAVDPLTTHYIEDPKTHIVTQIDPVLAPGEKRHIVYFHDESVFNANEFKSSFYMHTTQQKTPKKNAKGRAIHDSDFISTEGRICSFGPDGNVVRDARKIIYPGKNGDAWWDTKQLHTQVVEAIDIFEQQHPGCIAVFVFDQSSAHNSHGEGALNAFTMNLNDGGKAPILNDTFHPPETGQAKAGWPQRLYWELTNADGTISKRPKGITTVLRERGITELPKLKAKCSPKCEDPAWPPPPDYTPCCIARILQNHQDFREQKSVLQEAIESRSHKCIFLPKFHCELNPIEMYWGYCKARYRQVIKTGFKHAKQEVLIALNSCPIDTMRRFCNRSFRFMDAYRKGLSIKVAAWCVTKQKGHRAISESVMAEFDVAQQQ